MTPIHWTDVYIDLGLRKPEDPIAYYHALNRKLQITHYIGFGQKYRCAAGDERAEFTDLKDAMAWCEARAEVVA